MPISVECESCQRVIKVKDEFAGRKIRCPGCQASITLPQDDDGFGDVFEDEPTPAARRKSSKGASPRGRGKKAPANSPWYIRQWHWFVVLAMLLLALIPKAGLIIAGLIAGVGVLMALVGGIAPILRILIGAPGTVLTMIVSRSARFEMMNQPDDHPYKVLVRTAMDPTRGLFWRGVLLIVAFIPAAFVQTGANEINRQWARNARPAVAPHNPNLGPFGPGAVAGPGVNPQAPGGAVAGFPPGHPGLPPGAGNAQAGAGDDRLHYVKITYEAFKGEDLAKGVEGLLAGLPGYVADSVEVDEATKTIRFQHRGPINPRVILPLFGRNGFGSASYRASTKKPE